MVDSVPPAKAPFRVLAISGSLRRASINTAALEAFSRLAPEGVHVLVYRDLAKPGGILDGIAKAQIIADNNQGARIVAEEFARGIGPQGGDYAELLGRQALNALLLGDRVCVTKHAIVVPSDAMP